MSDADRLIYIDQPQYEVLAKLISNAQTQARLRFPVPSIQAGGLYFARREDIEIRTPGCLVLLTHPSMYDERHKALLDTTEVLTLKNVPDRPGWWRVL